MAVVRFVRLVTRIGGKAVRSDTLLLGNVVFLPKLRACDALFDVTQKIRNFIERSRCVHAQHPDHNLSFAFDYAAE